MPHNSEGSALCPILRRADLQLACLARTPTHTSSYRISLHMTVLKVFQGLKSAE